MQKDHFDCLNLSSVTMDGVIYRRKRSKVANLILFLSKQNKKNFLPFLLRKSQFLNAYLGAYFAVLSSIKACIFVHF